MPRARYIVGIDLGTTHTAVAYADIGDGAPGQPQLFEIEQLIAPGEVAKKPLLPSFRYHPTEGELVPEDLQLPWPNPDLPDELEQRVVGEWARELGSRSEGRQVASAKSWLSHTQVDQTAAILPWAAAEDVARVSPVLASASYLSHVRSAWNLEHPEAPLEAQQVIVTVPASFDEAARSLTVEAAAMAGLPDILLVEEPQAACYDWYARNRDSAAEQLADVRLLLVCDVGGGTTDLSLIRVATDENGLSLSRVGVGDHLMLGGDNIDLALAHRAEQRLLSGDGKLRAASLAQLIQQTRKAKEQLLAEDAPETARVTLLGAGRSLIGGARSCELSRDEVKALALDGFFPEVSLDTRPQRRRGAVVEFGLPYAADPAISKHLAEFLGRHRNACREALQLDEDATEPAVPDAVLFNGGVFNSATVSARLLDILGQWRGAPVRALENRHPDLAVAYGAVAYGLARRGAALKIGGGSARSFFLQIDAGGEEGRQGVCLLPRGSEEGDEVRLSDRRFALRLGQPVGFHLLSTSADTRYAPGELVAIDPENFVDLPPLFAALEGDDGDSAEVEVELVTTLTEVGTLKIECVSLADSAKRWAVEFQVRRDLARHRQGQSRTAALPPRFDEAQALIDDVFGQSKKEFDPKAVKRLRNDLEKILGKRESWETPLLRALFDEFLEGRHKRRRSEHHERVWFNLAGYCLRPGFGYPLDDWRLQQIWPLYRQGLQFDKGNPAWSNWWVFWRRAAGGLDAGQQQELFKAVGKYLDPVALRNRKLMADLQDKAYDDMVQLVAGLERLPVETKVKVGDWLLKRLEKKSETQTSWWAVGRIGARVLFHRSAHNVVPVEVATRWLQKLLAQDWKKNQQIAFAAVMLARMSGDRSLDLEAADRNKVIAKLEDARLPPLWVELVSEARELSDDENQLLFGEKLPTGLKLID
ncbi:molecular chaperone DnaK [Marinobacterium nitratireducens]|uniref:Molecular chaperone DnaK n=1 Tax=Marinobacterium nitratireducens TaxID=518897 RepID=A0A917ZEP9_9GAMM|nr:Hsp70 family protein [Marinobacterium nitratireducens]GGO81651.1 molecular chaperone DnaK [Marinobacterium nitratireducens]